jgi:two-component system, OmpR family, sensor kinase
VSRVAEKLRVRLIQRIYFAGVLQFVIVAIATGALIRASRTPPFIREHVQFLARELAAQSASPEALQAATQRVYAELHWALAVHDEHGHVVAAAGPPIARAGRDEEARGDDLPPIGSVPIALAGRGNGRMEYAAPRAPGPPAGLASTSILILVVVGVSSWLTARSLATPLARLAAAANAFGAGNLSARASLERSDELGEVANAFDRMADRVTGAIRAERELLANISHELRTPLQRIRIALDLAAEGDAETARESLREIAEDLTELEQLVDDVLSATRLSLTDGASNSAVPPQRRELFESRSLLDKAAARFRGAHAERRFEASLDADALIEGDPVLLRRAIDNLLENAHKYSEGSTPVSLRADTTPDAVVIEVCDEGVGIATDVLPRVFEPFFRADRSRARATGGVGLGLALAKRIVEAHGGRLTLESVHGRGTTARVELPRAASTRGEARRSD